jgi:uncharacterized membrane protein SpoIIM required for sporulation
MPEPDSKRRRLPAILIAATIALALPIAYIFSVGPVHWLAAHGYIRDESLFLIEWFYAPLYFVAARIDAVNRGLQWWLLLWD